MNEKDGTGYTQAEEFTEEIQCYDKFYIRCIKNGKYDKASQILEKA